MNIKLIKEASVLTKDEYGSVPTTDGGLLLCRVDLLLGIFMAIMNHD